MWRIALAAVLTACLAAFALNAPRVHAQFNGCQAGFCNPKVASSGTVNNMTVDGTQSGCPTSTAPTLTFSTTKTNDVLVLAILPASNGVTVSAVSQTGLTWTQHTSNLSGSQTLYEYSAVASSVITGGTLTVTQSASAFTIMELIAIHGANTSSPFDPNGALPNKSASAADAHVTTTNSATLPIAMYTQNTVGSPTAGTGFTGISTGGCFGIMEYTTTFPTTPQSSLDMTLTTGSGDQFVGIGDAITQ